MQDCRNTSQALLSQKQNYIEELKVSHRNLIEQKDHQFLEIKLTHQTFVAEKERHIEDLQKFIMIQSMAAVMVVVALFVVTWYLLGIRSEEKHRLETQNNKYQAMIEDKIQQLQKDVENEQQNYRDYMKAVSLEVSEKAAAAASQPQSYHSQPHSAYLSQHQPPFVYAIPSFPQTATPASTGSQAANK